MNISNKDYISFICITILMTAANSVYASGTYLCHVSGFSTSSSDRESISSNKQKRFEVSVGESWVYVKTFYKGESSKRSYPVVEKIEMVTKAVLYKDQGMYVEVFTFGHRLLEDGYKASYV